MIEKCRIEGFTLLELSIVLVIIGLIIGGITVGADMIRSAELQGVISDKNKIEVTVNSFKLKYNAIPGDMKNATAFWGAAHATPATCVTTASSGTETCNGDGDGVIDDSSGSNEKFRFWQHLANADLWPGQFTGVKAASNSWSADSSNVAEFKVSGSLWYVNSQASGYSGGTFYFAGEYQNYLLLGGFLSNAEPLSFVLSPPELYSIDQKIDDGKPAKGKLLALRWNNCTDATSNTDLDSDYLLDQEALLCGASFIKMF